ncbi:hypothetical protein MD535_23645 [Vibrio sp. ZSDZ65]|uniref:Lipoprotein n=1 Tax=Vibrio qingdaonensis TaxID=2829491 RepID=A0A9X3CV24_9VIBR|nr:hypothetical protein [Vibrio qingdaonensis]MCW8348990.1 hypothetical protein [Vibrio qingdaonensis]
MSKTAIACFFAVLTLTGCAGVLQSGYVYPPFIPEAYEYHDVRSAFGLLDDKNVVGLVVVYSPAQKSLSSVCNDGSYSSSLGKGACSWHGGVKSTSTWSIGPRYLVKYLLATDGSCSKQMKFSLEVLEDRDSHFFCKKEESGLPKKYEADVVPIMDLVGWKTYSYSGDDTQILPNRL